MSNHKHLRQITVRAVSTNNFSFNDNNLNVSGYVNETGKPSDPIPNWGETDEIPNDASFVEIMAPGVFKDALQNADFVDFYLEHDPSQFLASTQQGSLKLNEDSTGLKMSANIVPTSLGQDAYTLIKSGVVKSMSFGFIPLDAQWDLSGDTPVRTVTKIQLLEVSAVRFPAYPDSSISARKKHFKRLNAALEKRGYTLSNQHYLNNSKNRGEHRMTNINKRANNNASQGLTSADAQTLANAMTSQATSLDNLTNAVQENSEVVKNVFEQLLQSANDDRAKKQVHKSAKKGSDGKEAKDAKKSKSKKPNSSKATSNPDSSDDPETDAKKAKKEKDAKKKAKNAKKAQAAAKEKDNKRSKNAADMFNDLKRMNEDVD